MCLGAEGKAEKIYQVDWVLDGGVAAAGIATTLTSYALAESWIRKRCPCDPNEVNGFDRPAIGNRSNGAATASDLLVGASILGPALADLAILGWSRELLEDGLIYTQALALSGALVTIVKHLAQRPIPRTYAGDAETLQSTEGYRSFYSGHVTLAVTALSAASFTATRRHGARLWPWLVTAGAGAAVGIGRVAGGYHFYTDVIVGMAAGAAVGVVVPWLHTISGGTVSILPQDQGARMLWTWVL